ncbi:cell envelope integrity protein CreD [Roseivirga thermotolerans]|uniref:Cell envelope integrity protein CreD n=1 Tax=Roseivirga thermotolerans TaxID=1758176 RepID=A0ABQ3I1L5_9BACT|nr:cell envelope integrity protein CreD [Roseivirga thermotolerans]GHE54541.1 cell envelope integrity protein CreD [Roseivirga thermotolerans]
MKNSTNSTVFDKINYSFKHSVSIKLLSIGFLIAILLIPNHMIKSLISEREIRQKEAIQEISESWASPQEITGPILTIPYESVVTISNSKEAVIVKYAHFLPEALNIEGQMEPKSRKRGIYNVSLYASQLKIDGSFSTPDFSNFLGDTDKVLWHMATISMGIPDMRGIQNHIVLQLGDKALTMEPGIPQKINLDIEQSTNPKKTVSNDYQNGVSANLTWNPEWRSISFSTELSLHGTKSLTFNPIGKTTLVKIRSTWPHPSFNGQFLPDAYTTSENGFNAEWSIFDLNRNYPQQWADKQHRIYNSGFGVMLFQPVDNYHQNMRSAKYAVLILFLTFLAFFFIETLNKTRIHPIHYILVGLALTIFYTLLLSISEHLQFGLAYRISAVVVIGMTSLYSKSILKSKRLAVIILLFFSIIYTFVYIVLQLEDYALLFGSIGLLLVLGVCMYMSRNIDWYNLKPKETINHA